MSKSPSQPQIGFLPLPKPPKRQSPKGPATVSCIEAQRLRRDFERSLLNHQSRYHWRTKE